MKSSQSLGVLIALSFFAPASLLSAPPDGAYVQLFQNKDLKGSAVTVNADMADLKTAVTDDGQKGFDDRASSAKYDVPSGWEVVLYEDANFQNRVAVLKGVGELKDLSKGEDKVSSLRWEQR